MTRKELVELLEKYPDDLRGIVKGYEDGFDDISPERISTTKIQLDVGTHNWKGQHGDIPYDNETTTDNAEIVKVLVFHRAWY